MCKAPLRRPISKLCRELVSLKKELQGIYEFLSARMWDEDNEKDYNFARRINEKHSFKTPRGETVIIETAFQESW